MKKNLSSFETDEKIFSTSGTCHFRRVCISPDPDPDPVAKTHFQFFPKYENVQNDLNIKKDFSIQKVAAALPKADFGK